MTDILGNGRLVNIASSIHTCQMIDLVLDKSVRAWGLHEELRVLHIALHGFTPATFLHGLFSIITKV